jgi:transposase
MKYVGADLHKESISLCVVVIVDGKRQVVARAQRKCRDLAGLRQWFAELGQFQLAVEATAAYEWLFLLIEDLANRLVLSHPKKLRVIAESTRKTDKIDAEVLATFLALDMLPQAYRPSPRVRQHRVLVRHRRWIIARITATKCKLRHKLAQYNEDIANLFTRAGQEHLAKIAMSAADRFEVRQLQQQFKLWLSQLDEVDRELEQFAASASQADQEGRAVLQTMPQVGPVTCDVVLSELGDWRRFHSAKEVVAYSGLAPGVRESGGKRHDLHISREGSRLLRWALIEAAWRLIRLPRWRTVYERLVKSTGSKKKAIVGVARRVLCVMFSMLRTGQAYRFAAEH